MVIPQIHLDQIYVNASLVLSEPKSRSKKPVWVGLLAYTLYDVAGRGGGKLPYETDGNARHLA